MDKVFIHDAHVYVFQSWNLFNSFIESQRFNSAIHEMHALYILHCFKHGSSIKHHTCPEISFYLNYNILFSILIDQIHILCAKITT